MAAPRLLYYVAKYELFKNPISNWFLRSLGGIPFNRERPLESRQSLHDMIEFLGRGEGIVVFPEGTYYRGTVGDGRVGVVRFIASHVSLPFIPVGIRYSNRGIRTNVRISFGKVFYIDAASTAGLFLDMIMKEIKELSELD